jgi:hypothetical protein
MLPSVLPCVALCVAPCLWPSVLLNLKTFEHPPPEPKHQQIPVFESAFRKSNIFIIDSSAGTFGGTPWLPDPQRGTQREPWSGALPRKQSNPSNVHVGHIGGGGLWGIEVHRTIDTLKLANVARESHWANLRSRQVYQRSCTWHVH